MAEELVLTKIGLKGTGVAYEAKDEIARNLAAQAQTAADNAVAKAEDMKTQVDEANAQVESLSGQLTSTQSQLQTVRNQLATANNKIATLDPVIDSPFGWDSIIALADRIKANPDNYRGYIGSVRNTIQNGEEIGYRVIGISHDVDSSGNSVAVTFQATKSICDMNMLKRNSSSAPTSYRDTEVHYYLNNTFFNSLPSNIRNAIKTVVKPCNAYGKFAIINDVDCKVFIASYKELTGSGTYGSLGDRDQQYEYWTNKVGANADDYAAFGITGNSGNKYYTRLMRVMGISDYYFNIIGSNSVSKLNEELGIVPCFCI